MTYNPEQFSHIGCLKVGEADQGLSMCRCSEMVHAFAESLGLALDARDRSTCMHSKQVADISLFFAKALGFDEGRAALVHVAGHLHDIGKMGLPDSILKKPGPLNSDEWRLMKAHPVIGARIVAPIRLFNGKNGIQNIILHHHERYDGKGYPNGTKGKDIPFGARIIAVADSLSAMLQDRPYRKGMDFDDVMKNNAGSQFCPLVVNVFKQHVEEIYDYYNE